MTQGNVGVAKRAPSLILFLVLVLGGGLAIGGLTVTGGWYADLAKPAFSPPDWLFGPVWTVLYVFIAIAGWRTWHRDRAGRSMKLWFSQMALNFLWTPIYFGAHQIGIALAIILLLLAAILSFIVCAWRPDRMSAGLFVPYAVWVAFASALNASIWVLN
jgi:tryptophan-rich sensory protein